MIRFKCHEQLVPVFELDQSKSNESNDALKLLECI